MQGALVGQLVYPPVNGTPTAFGKGTDFVEIAERPLNASRQFEPPSRKSRLVAPDFLPRRTV